MTSVFLRRNMNAQKDFVGKKIIFVHPPDLVRGPLMDLLSEREFEAYVLRAHNKIPDIYKAYPDTVFFLNIDTALNDAEWQIYIKHLNRSCPGILLGIFSFRISQRELVQHYLLGLGISCGFIQMKQGVRAAGDMILKVLTANEVKGRRKYLRCQCYPEDRSMARFLNEGTDITGRIQDISSVGMSCRMSSSISLVKNQLVKNMQLRLKGVIVSCDAVLVGKKAISGLDTLYVFLFRMGPQDKMKSRIRSYIYGALQRQLNHDFGLSE